MAVGHQMSDKSTPEGEDKLEAFQPEMKADAQVLILGSMPGIKSLEAQQYYAHKQNSFWYFMQEMFGIERSSSYAQRLTELKSCKIALWDVVHSCVRPGSLDSNIQASSVRANDFAALLKSCPKIHSVFFNGQKAASLFKKHIDSSSLQAFKSIGFTSLPSSSPAHASMRPAEKLASWMSVKDCITPECIALNEDLKEAAHEPNP